MASLQVRQATERDVEPILQLLTHYELPRAVFEPFYLEDPEYDPSHSWVAEEGTTLLAHLRIYPKDMRLLGGVVRMGGIGNVVTARGARGRGVARTLLRRVCAHLDETYAVSLLWTHAHRVYEAHGWHSVPQDVAIIEPRASSGERSSAVQPGAESDVDAAVLVKERADAGRSGTVPRTRQQWLALRATSREDVRRFLVLRDAAGDLHGYIRVRPRHNVLDVIELAAMPRDVTTASALIRAAGHPGERLTLTLPPSLHDAVTRDDVVERPASQLMLRICSPRLLAAGVADAVRSRADRGARVSLRGASGRFALSVGDDGVSVERLTRDGAGAPDGAISARLLLYGAERDGADAARDRALHQFFPPQDTVVWPADRF